MDETTRPQEQPEQASARPQPDAPQAAAHPQPAPQTRPYGPPYPGQFAPQPLAPAPAPRPSPFKHGFGLGAGAGLGLGGALLVFSLVATLLGGLVLMGFAGAASSLSRGGQTAAEPLDTVWGTPTAQHRLRAIPVVGAIQTAGADGLALSASTYGYEVAQVIDGLDAADADGLVLVLDTPGGTVTGSRAMSDAADRYRERTGKKVFAFVQGMSASGGMYTMAGADEIVADHGSIVGSVGVIMGPIERYRDVTQSGSILGSVTAGQITSEYITRGLGKDAGQPYRDLTAEERANLEGIIDEMYTDFVDHVATKRGIDRGTLVNELGAYVFTGEKAKEVGYIDDVMGRDDAMRHFATTAGLDPADTRLVQAAAPAPWASLLGAESRAWGTAPAATAEAGQPVRATAKMCTDPTTPLAWHGPLVGVCS